MYGRRQHLFRSYRAEKVLRDAHCVDGRVHAVPREVTDLVDAIDESALAINVCCMGPESEMGKNEYISWSLPIPLVFAGCHSLKKIASCSLSQARVAWAWANEKVRTVHVKRGDDWQIAPLSFEVG